MMSRLIPSLPDEISILCIARVSPCHYPLLSAVSRAWLNLIRSPLLFSTRIEVGASQPFLFISIVKRSAPYQYHWYLLDRSLRRLIPLPAQPHPSAILGAAVSLGHSLYLFGGLINGEGCPIVQIYDASLNYWRRGPDMSIPRGKAQASVISGRIYVVGGSSIHPYWAEEFDPGNDRWRPVPSPPLGMHCHGNANGSVVIGGKLFVMMKGCLCVSDPTVLETELVTQAEKAWSWASYGIDFRNGRAAVVEEVLYNNYSNSRNTKWYDFTKDEWTPVEGVNNKELPKLSRGARLANFGQELCLVSGGRWEGEKIEVICVGVSLTKIDTGEIQGSVEWEETCALSCPRGTSIEDCISLEF